MKLKDAAHQILLQLLLLSVSRCSARLKGLMMVTHLRCPMKLSPKVYLGSPLPLHPQICSGLACEHWHVAAGLGQEGSRTGRSPRPESSPSWCSHSPWCQPRCPSSHHFEAIKMELGCSFPQLFSYYLLIQIHMVQGALRGLHERMHTERMQTPPQKKRMSSAKLPWPQHAHPRSPTY